MSVIKLISKLKGLFRKFEIPEGHIETALKVTTKLKKMLSSPIADIITAVIPGEIDNAIRHRLVNALGIAIEALSIAESCRQHTDLNEKLKCFVTNLQLRDPNLQDALLQKLASLLTGHLDNQRLRQSLYDLYTQARYTSSK